MSSSTKIDNRTKNILILGKGPTQGLEHTLSAEKMYSINFTVKDKKLSLRYNGANSYSVATISGFFALNLWISLIFVNGKEIHKFKAKNPEIVATLLCLGSISKDWTVHNMKKIGLNGYVQDFRVDYVAITVDNILDIHNYLMKRNDIV